MGGTTGTNAARSGRRLRCRSTPACRRVTLEASGWLLDGLAVNAEWQRGRDRGVGGERVVTPRRPRRPTAATRRAPRSRRTSWPRSGTLACVLPAFVLPDRPQPASGGLDDSTHHQPGDDDSHRERGNSPDPVVRQRAVQDSGNQQAENQTDHDAHDHAGQDETSSRAAGSIRSSHHSPPDPEPLWRQPRPHSPARQAPVQTSAPGQQSNANQHNALRSSWSSSTRSRISRGSKARCH